MNTQNQKEWKKEWKERLDNAWTEHLDRVKNGDLYKVFKDDPKYMLYSAQAFAETDTKAQFKGNLKKLERPIDYETFKLTSDGTPEGSILEIDGKSQPLLQRIYIDVNTKELVIKLEVEEETRRDIINNYIKTAEKNLRAKTEAEKSRSRVPKYFKYFCKKCDSSDVEGQNWRNLNTGKNTEPVNNSPIWCNQCNLETELKEEE